MKEQFHAEFESLIEKYCELLIGESDAESIEKIKVWSIYQQIYRTMPPLTKHWGETHPNARQSIRQLFEEIKTRNDELKANQEQLNSERE